MKLTELEKDVIVAIAENQYADIPSDPVWSFAIDYHTKITKTEQISGVVSSLVKKGLAECSGEGKDSTVQLTDEGVKSYHKIKGGLRMEAAKIICKIWGIVDSNRVGICTYYWGDRVAGSCFDCKHYKCDYKGGKKC